MFWDNNEGLGGKWDEGGEIIEDIIFQFIKKYINNELKKAGLDPDNWRRQAARMGATAIGVFVSSIAGGPVGFLVGLLGYLISSNTEYPEDKERAVKNTLFLQAGGIATKALENSVSRSTWGDIVDEVHYTVKKHKDSKPGIERSISLIHDAIGHVNKNAANQWQRVYKLALRESNI